ncbi:MAG: ribonuclease J [Actinomycetota bacterium]
MTRTDRPSPGQVSVSFLGGLGTIGRNCALVETAETTLVLDCGQLFPPEHRSGTIQAILPDLTEIAKRSDRLGGIVLSHSHEDHLGAVAYLLREVETDVIGSRFTLAVLERKLDEEGLRSRANFREVADGDRLRLGDIECEFLPVTHSTPGGLMTVFRTPQGVIVHSSDFKLDNNPVDGRRTGLGRLASIAQTEGVRLLLADSTNADSEGWTPSETQVGPSLRSLIDERPGRRIIVAAYARHIHRVQQIVDAGVANNRTIVPLGRSMEEISAIARELGELDVPPNRLASPDSLADLEPEETLVVCTGSQGEPSAALARMADGSSKWLKLGSQDSVILSSAAIPGNEVAIAELKNSLLRRGAEVIAGAAFDLHTSGHGNREELRVLHSVAEPTFFIPVHGEFYHLVAHAELATSMGMRDENVVVCEDGDQVTMSDGAIAKSGSVSSRWCYVDRSGVPISEAELDDLELLGRHGAVSVMVVVDLATRRLLAEPVVASRGWTSDVDMERLHGDAARVVRDAVTAELSSDAPDVDSCTRSARRALGRFVQKSTRRRPVLLPVVQAISG